MATADYYEGQHVTACPSCGLPLVRVPVLSPTGKLDWDVRHTPEDQRRHLLAQARMPISA